MEKGDTKSLLVVFSGVVNAAYNTAPGFMNPFWERARQRHPMEKSDPYSEWVILSTKEGKTDTTDALDEELLAAAREAWPHALAHARRELSDRIAAPDRTALAAEIWERVLRSVSRTLQHSPDRRPAVQDLQAYLMGAFHLRFNRVLRREQRRLDTFELLPSTFDLEKFESARDAEWVRCLEQDITVKAVLARMDEVTRRMWKGRQAGFSWKEIAREFGITERHAKRKFREGIERTRHCLIEVMRRRRKEPKAQE
jgi:DNA-directed RNA polymerase specialized sigma24 family protein